MQQFAARFIAIEAEDKRFMGKKCANTLLPPEDLQSVNFNTTAAYAKEWPQFGH